MKYKFGDKVIVKSFGCSGGTPESASHMVGKQYKIDDINFGCYIINGLYFSESEVEKVLNRTIEDVQEGDLITNGTCFSRILGRSGKAVFTTYTWKRNEEEKTHSNGSAYSIQELINNGCTIVDETPKPETITINGKEYNKQEVEEVIKDLKSL